MTFSVIVTVIGFIFVFVLPFVFRYILFDFSVQGYRVRKNWLVNYGRELLIYIKRLQYGSIKLD